MASPPLDDVLDCPAPEGARRAGLELLEQTAHAHERLQGEPADAAALHDFRVALRRLRSWLRAFSAQLDGAVSAKVTRRLRALQEATGASRDLDVRRGWLDAVVADSTADARAGAEWVRHQLAAAPALDVEWLHRRFARCEGVLHATFATYTLKLPVGAAPQVTPFSWEWATVLRELLADLFQAASDASGAEQPELLHRVRIRTKRLRYVLAPLKSWPEAAEALDWLKARQAALGTFRDRQLLLAALANAEAESTLAPGLAALHALARAQQADALEQYLALRQHDLELARAVEAVCTRLSRRRGLVVEVMPAPDG